MEFALVDTQKTIDSDESEYTSEEEETYDDIHQNKKTPVMSTVEKKRENKTVECPGCHRKMNKKTYKYSHKCPIAKQKKDTSKEKEIHTDAPQEQDMLEMFLKQEVLKRENMIRKKQENLDRLIGRAF